MLVIHTKFPKQLPLHARAVCLCGLCGLHASRSHTGLLNERTFLGQLSLVVFGSALARPPVAAHIHKVRMPQRGA